MSRGFEAVSRYVGQDGKSTIDLPKRSTRHSAGYDFFAPEDVIIPPMFFQYLKAAFGVFKTVLPNGCDVTVEEIKPYLIKTGVKAYMQTDEYLALLNRSSNPKKLGLILANSVGIIDKDYYNNPDNEGEMGFAYYNVFPWPVTIKKGEKLGQGIFQKFLLADADDATGMRTGGWGSTSEKV